MQAIKRCDCLKNNTALLQQLLDVRNYLKIRGLCASLLVAEANLKIYLAGGYLQARLGAKI